MKTIFNVPDVAKICKVAPRTVSKWFDSGRLKGYRIPGTQDRRILRDRLVSFLREHGMPVDELLGDFDRKQAGTKQQWGIRVAEDSIDIIDGDGRKIVGWKRPDLDVTHIDYGEKICFSVNNHDALVAAATEALRVLRGYDVSMYPPTDVVESIAQLESVLAAVKG